jgi:hypothetical protein
MAMAALCFPVVERVEKENLVFEHYKVRKTD